MGGDMFGGLVYGLVVFMVAAFLAGIGVTTCSQWAWPKVKAAIHEATED